MARMIAPRSKGISPFCQAKPVSTMFAKMASPRSAVAMAWAGHSSTDARVRLQPRLHGGGVISHGIVGDEFGCGHDLAICDDRGPLRAHHGQSVLPMSHHHVGRQNQIGLAGADARREKLAPLLPMRKCE